MSNFISMVKNSYDIIGDRIVKMHKRVSGENKGA